VETRSDWFKPLCILALVFGLGGMCCDLFSITGLVLNESIVGAAGQNAQATLEAQRPYKPWLMLLGGLNLAQTISLTLGAALCLRDVRRFARLLRAALIGGLVLTPIGFATGVFVQLALPQIKPVGLPDGFGGAMIGFTLVLGGGWALGKMAFFFVTLRVLRKQLESGATTAAAG
jgi:hypothetical protein